ncbi:probable 26s proteasome non-atpase regulatory subunit 3-like [Stylonychia lemnae]|uniref:Probable 26s proteasome non-atpase regulatory subunit 3-like n=1 Tax=Stylonychia lemnae TaxID=5949 RepID=A0A077ZV58_STYLE|nr:probable 26s proteasome non-atpase regulatory subunit 3-like [Stylonychia lemnae]|eukprot:CDW73499.1 probable 26s proteasome non-atpase regulatory subunit 3-like [Stylonychia lemnae]
MKDDDASKKVEDKKVPEVADPFFEFKKVMVLLEKAAKDKDYKLAASLTKQFKKLRKLLNLSDTVLILKHYIPDLFQRLQLPCQPTPITESAETKLQCTNQRALEIMQHAETQLFLYNLLLMKLIDDGDLNNAKQFGDFVYLRLKNVSLRTLDHLAAKSLYLYSVIYEKLKSLHQIRPVMFEAYKTACLRSDQIGQATITNIILRSYLSQNLYEQARNFIVKTSFPESASNNQNARYLYYLGRIKAVQLEYSEAQARLIQALRKGPEVGAIGFRTQVQKLQIITELLMGEIPNRQIFSHPDFKKSLAPYYQVVTSVKSGDMETFKKILQSHQGLFEKDKNFTLIQRLRHTVIKFGLKKINISYSKISIKDIAQKLGLDSVDETEQVVAKAIRDGVIDAIVDHDNMWMRSQDINDVYTSNDPQNILNKRIKFCMDLHNDAVKALEFPPKEDKRDFGDLDEERSTKEEDILASLLEEMGMDGDM